MFPHLILVAGMTSVLFLAWRADHPRIEDEPKRSKFARSQAVPSITKLRLNVRLWSLRKPESTEGGRRVSVLKRQEGAPVLLG